jgi:protein-disulfide isomerase
LSRFRILAALLAICLTAGCKAQSTATSSQLGVIHDEALLRRIEVMVRSQFGVPPDYAVNIGAREAGKFPGYDKLPVTLTRGDKKTTVDFLISTDNKTLARLDSFDLSKDPALEIDISGRPIRGNPAAKVTVVNFDDLECPYCARLHRSLFPDTLARYKDKVRFVYKDNPLPPEMHPWAMHAAVDANCLAAQSGDVYWTYVDYLHSHGDEVTGPDRNLPKSYAALDRIARQEATVSKLDAAKLDACLAKQDETEVRASLKQAEALKIESAPAVFVDGERFDGAIPEEQVWQIIDRALRAAGEQPPPPPALPAPPGPTNAPAASVSPAPSGK